jgi:two-component system, LuxR family, sensor kinase FixL
MVTTREVSVLSRPFLATALAAAIFLIDTLTQSDSAVAVLYVIVVLISTNFLSQGGVFAVGLGCSLLTLVSFAVVHWNDAGSGSAVRCIVSLCAVSTTTFLAVRNQQSIADANGRAALLGLTHDAILVRRLAGGGDRISYWNGGAASLYGWTDQEAVGRDASELLRTRWPRAREAIFRELAAEGHWQGELVHTRRDGTEVIVDSRWSLQRDASGAAVAVLELNKDVTARKRAEDALHRARAELAHVTRVATLGELVASIAHEIRQPLASVVNDGNAGLRWLRRSPPDLGEARESLERMVGNACRANDVISRLRALADKAPVQRSVFGLPEIVSDIMPLVERELLTNSIDLRLSLDESHCPIEADRVQIQQVLINLVVNAIQAMSTIQDRPRILAITSVRCSEGHSGPSVGLEVRDSGIGIDPAIGARMFTAFYSTKSDGMGMGLSICRSIVEAHGGRITASPNADWGAVFTMTIPAALQDGGEHPAQDLRPLAASPAAPARDCSVNPTLVPGPYRSAASVPVLMPSGLEATDAETQPAISDAPPGGEGFVSDLPARRSRRCEDTRTFPKARMAGSARMGCDVS